MTEPTALSLARDLLKVLPRDANPRLRSELRRFIGDSICLEQRLADRMRQIPPQNRDAAIQLVEALGLLFDGMAVGEDLKLAAMAGSQEMTTWERVIESWRAKPVLPAIPTIPDDERVELASLLFDIYRR